MVDREPDILPLMSALYDGGIRAFEVTLRTTVGYRAITVLREDFPDCVVGAGTVLAPGEADQAIDAGAMFGVSPGIDTATLEFALNHDLPFYPGVLTTSDISLALSFGIRHLKYFPAEAAGGLKSLKATAAPYLHKNVRFIPLGGLRECMIKEYLETSFVAALGGSWIASANSVRRRDWDGIREAASSATSVVTELDQPGNS